LKKVLIFEKKGETNGASRKLSRIIGTKYFTSYRARVPRPGGLKSEMAKTVKTAKTAKRGRKRFFRVTAPVDSGVA
jgi:hypothetical protein